MNRNRLGDELGETNILFGNALLPENMSKEEGIFCIQPLLLQAIDINIPVFPNLNQSCVFWSNIHNRCIANNNIL
jgi:hypothetical protein